MATIRDLAEGTKILSHYMKADAEIGGIDQDMLYVCPPDVQVTLDDARKLKEELGWSWDRKNGWGLFV